MRLNRNFTSQELGFIGDALEHWIEIDGMVEGKRVAIKLLEYLDKKWNEELYEKPQITP